jgi:hypothetical protein
VKIDLTHDVSRQGNDLSLFSRIEKDLPDDGDDESEDENSLNIDQIETDDELIGDNEIPIQYSRSDFIGALAVPPPSREELKLMGWELKICDLFLVQSFRVSLNGQRLVFPEHPVVVDSHRVSIASIPGAIVDDVALKLIETLFYRKSSDLQVDDLVDAVGGGTIGRVFTLIEALVAASDEESGNINSEKFNQWLSLSNSESLKSRGESAFSPAAALTSRDYSPSASELLISGGNPRLALVAIAAKNPTSRQLMKSQLGSVNASGDIGDVYKILAGRVDAISKSTAPDWRSQLALRYWYGDGDLTGFEPPVDSVEWRIIQAVVMRKTDELLSLVDIAPKLAPVVLASIALMKTLRPELVSEEHYSRIVRVCSDSLFSCGRWDWAVVCFSLLPQSDQRERLIHEIVSRHADKDLTMVEKFGLISKDKLLAATSLATITYGVSQKQ